MPIMFIAVDDRDPRPTYLQIAAAIKQQVAQGCLVPGAALPSVRELARDLGINLHTARHAYQILNQQGVIHLRLGRRARIAPLRESPAAAEGEAALARQIAELATEAFHLGVSPDRFRQLVDEALQNQQMKREES
jgi:DNA-binding transcriptional regulator YhcF (GntR family)